MSNATEASKIVRNLVASGQIRNYRRSKYQERRLGAGTGASRYHGGTWLAWIVAGAVWAVCAVLLGAAG